ncbi:MAG: nucleotidyltransferase domain-containing protein [Myxococcales bacterium]|nr:nucleotidyltransferase domain-containing protein [Myxococcales bacterium]
MRNPQLEPDLEHGRRFIAHNSPAGRVIMCGITGSHFYGFPSPDSDLDLKGIHVAPTVSVLGLDQPPETFDRLEVFDGLECDYTSHEARKALSLLLRGNGNMLERILSPIQLYETPELLELQALARGAISKCFASHYRGFFKGMCREHGLAEEPRAKTLLYAYRVALTGIHLMRTGELVGDVAVTAPLYGFDSVADLAALKQAGTEYIALSAEENVRHRAGLGELESKLAAASDESRLPDSPPNLAECEAWLVALRRREL